MADTTGNTGTGTGTAHLNTQPRKSSWKYIGPGIVVAATGVGAGDLVATLIAGSNFGYTLLWAAVIGCLVKISLAEAAGRWHLSTGRTLFDGWASLGRWTTYFFVVYVVVWGFVYGAAAMSSSALRSRRCSPTCSPPRGRSSRGRSSAVWSAWSSSGSTSTRCSRRS